MLGLSADVYLGRGSVTFRKFSNVCVVLLYTLSSGRARAMLCLLWESQCPIKACWIDKEQLRLLFDKAKHRWLKREVQTLGCHLREGEVIYHLLGLSEKAFFFFWKGGFQLLHHGSSKQRWDIEMRTLCPIQRHEGYISIGQNCGFSLRNLPLLFWP